MHCSGWSQIRAEPIDSQSRLTRTQLQIMGLHRLYQKPRWLKTRDQGEGVEYDVKQDRNAKFWDFVSVVEKGMKNDMELGFFQKIERNTDHIMRQNQQIIELLIKIFNILRWESREKSVSQ